MTSKALLLTGAKTLRVEERPQAPPRENELQVAVLGTTLCGSDLHYYNSYRNGFIVPKHPMILGHEACGRVTAIGSAVGDKWKIGDLVALEVGVSCGHCRVCKEGRYNICPGLRFRSSAKYPTSGELSEERIREDLEGTLQTTLNHNADWCHKLPPSFAVPLACLLEPLAVALHATSRVQIDNSTRVLILGAGPVGIFVCHCANVRGGKTLLTDINTSRIEYASQNSFGDERLLLPMNVSPEETARHILQESAQQDGYDVVFECSGVPAVINTAIHSAAAGGNVVLLGIPPATVEIDLAKASLREVNLVGSFRYAGEYPKAIEVASQAGLDKVITHTVHGLEEVEKGFAIMQSKELAMKVCVLME